MMDGVAKKKIGLFGGSFNPVHTGHLILANYIMQVRGLDEVWFVLSPLNPFKQDDEALIPDRFRLEMLGLAVDGVDNMKVSDVELTMPRPNYTVNTLERLTSLYPEVDFTLIIGADNYDALDKWKSVDHILDMADMAVYPRMGFATPIPSDNRITIVDSAPVIELSSTMIRKMIAEGESVNFMIPPAVYNYIRDNNLYASEK